MYKQTRYSREARGTCKTCSRELDVVVPWVGRPGGAGPQIVGMESIRWGAQAPVIARHLHRIEEYTSKGAKPAGFCPGSLQAFDPASPKFFGQRQERQ